MNNAEKAVSGWFDAPNPCCQNVDPVDWCAECMYGGRDRKEHVGLSREDEDG